jgi:hypothetical protein
VSGNQKRGGGALEPIPFIPSDPQPPDKRVFRSKSILLTKAAEAAAREVAGESTSDLPATARPVAVSQNACSGRAFDAEKRNHDLPDSPK